VEFRLDEGQVELQQTVARFCADRFPLDSVGAREGAPVDRAAWRDMAALGMFSLLLPEDAGALDESSGLGAVEATLVFEQLGSHLVPGPVRWTVLAAGLVEGAATGDLVVGGIDAATTGPVLVEHARDIDALIVLGDEGVTLHRAAELPAPEPLESLDPLTPVGRFAPLRGGERIADTDELRVLGTLLTAAQLVGVASRALEVAQQYARERQQFGVPIGSFQAVKHLLADMYLRSTLAQSATYAAAAVVQDPGADDAARAVAGAKLLAAEAAIENASTAVQVLGGMGFTWDMLPNYLLKRAWVLEQSFGTVDDHADHLGSTLAGTAR
jgi:alkylation response protein AidB-like acyl-CoA dehydrogenase